MAERKKRAADVAVDPDREVIDMVRIRVRLGDKRAKLFTTRGAAVNGSVIELPESEAMYWCDKELAIPTRDEVMLIEPECYTEAERSDALATMGNTPSGPPDAA